MADSLRRIGPIGAPADLRGSMARAIVAAMRGKLARSTLVTLPLIALLGCGARTVLDLGGEATDAGPGLDAGDRDGGRRDAGPMPDAGSPDLELDCGRSEQYTTPRRPITLEATATGPAPVVTQRWTLTSTPVASMPRFMPGPAANQATLTPDVEGDYELTFEATDSDGRRASCSVTVHSVVGPPVAICPETQPLRTVQGQPLIVEGDGFDDEMVVSYLWEVVSLPTGATPRVDPSDAPVTEFLARTRGRYTLRLTVADFDMATDSCDVEILVTGPPDVTCPMSPVRAPTRRPVDLVATATDDVGIASVLWEMISQPSGSAATPMPANAEATRLTPDRQGTYQLRFTATDVEGLMSSCEVTVIGEPTPPTVTCPATVTTAPLNAVSITATAEDDGTIVSWRWALTDSPMGSSASPPSPANAAMTSFTPDIAGVYELTVTATDDDGMMGTCTTRVEAGNVDGLRVEMFWDTPGTDMDLHLLNPSATGWGPSGGNDDCYFGNCVSGGGTGRLEWGAPGTDDNPRLDIDDTNGFGPENINILRPQPGTYRVGVHAYRGSGPNAVTVRIYCGGSTTVPQQTFGPVTLRDHGGASSADLWRVADVTISAAGCTIADLSGPGGPNVRDPYRTTRTMR